MKSIIKSAKTIELAVESGLIELGLSRDEVEIEVIEEPTKGIFGIFGGSDAIVKIKEKKPMKIDIDDIFADTKISEEFGLGNDSFENFEDVQEEFEFEDELEEVEDDETYEEMEIVEVEEDLSHTQEENFVESEQIEEIDETFENESEEVFEEELEEVDITEGVEEFEIVESDLENLTNTRDLNFEGLSQVVTDEDDINVACEKIKRNLEDILVKMHIETKVSYLIKNSNSIEFNLTDISENDTGIVIGSKGETLNAIQYVLSLITNKNTQNYYRISLNVADYRDRRKKAIEANAQKVAFKVLKTKKSIALKPMNSYERRIVHFALQNYKNIETVSTGKFPNRKVVVKYSGQ